MEHRQRRTEWLVTDYFRTRPDTKLAQENAGVYELALDGEAASVFGGRSLKLAFEPEVAYQHSEAEHIRPSHPFLDIIANQLRRNPDFDPRLTEAYLPLNLLNGSALAVPGVTFDASVTACTAQAAYYPVYAMIYKITLQSAEPVSESIAVYVDGRSGALLPAAKGCASLEYAPGRPAGAGEERMAPFPDALRSARAEVERRVAVELAALNQANQSQLDAELKRLHDFYDPQIRSFQSATDERRRQLEAKRDTDIENFRNLLSCEGRIRLTGAVLLWAPAVAYRLTVSRRRTDRSYELAGPEYDGYSGLVKAEPCPRCGRSDRYGVCHTGAHLACDAEAGHGVKECGLCHDRFCAGHGSGCGACANPFCREHLQPCGFGQHSPLEKFCASCLKAAFDAQPICPACAKTCQLCRRLFPARLVAQCRLGQETFCGGHDRQPDGAICAECGQPSCRKHGSLTADKAWACSDHQRPAACCGRPFRKSLLIACQAEPSEWLCRDHALHCEMGGEAICEKHVKRSLEGGLLCPIHAGVCIHCQAQTYHRKDRLWACVVCRNAICKSHVKSCDICAATAQCLSHQGQLPRCAACGRESCRANGCSESGTVCKRCGMQYCRQCTGVDGCEACVHPDPISRFGNVLPALEQLTRHENVALAQVARQMLSASAHCRTQSGSNRTYHVHVVAYEKAWWKFTHKTIQLRIVTAEDGGAVRVIRVVKEPMTLQGGMQ